MYAWLFIKSVWLCAGRCASVCVPIDVGTSVSCLLGLSGCLIVELFVYVVVFMCCCVGVFVHVWLAH